MDPISISIFTGLIVSIAQKVFIEPLLNKGIDKRAAEKELKGAIEFAVKHTQEKFHKYFVSSNGCLDESFWKNPEINEQLWKTITDDTTPGRSPDFAILYHDVYCRIYEEPARISYDLFSRVLEEFWEHFLVRAKESQIFKSYYQSKIISQLDATVFPHQGKQMMAEYCRTMAEKLEKKTFSRFFPKELKNSELTDEQINREFFDYKRTRLTYEQKHDSSIRHKGEVLAIEGDSFLDHGKIVFIGPGGVGKTRFMVELERKLVGEIAASQTDPDYLPIYFKASEFKEATKTSLSELFETKLRDGLPSGVYSDAKIRGFIQYLLGDPQKEESGRLFAVIDAFDQIQPEKEDCIYRLCADNVLLGKCRTYVSSRPYRLDQLRGGIQRAGGDVDTFQTILIHPFEFNELTLFFKDYYDRIEPFIKRLNRDQEDDINLVQLPLFARLIKIMAIKKRFLPIEEIGLKSRAGLMRYFIDFVVKEQIEKDIIPDQATEEKESNYRRMELMVEELSLKTLEDGQIYEFDREFAEDMLGDSFLASIPLAKRIEFIINKIFDYEGETSTREKKHRYQHQIFQEYFAAVALYKLYRKSKKDPQKGKAMRLSMENMEYMPEVAGFLADLVEEKGTEDDFHNWQKLLMAENNEDWVRTYALHMRDVLGKTKAQDALKRLFEEENNDLISHNSSLMVHVPEGSFVRGSYEYGNERPVTLINLDAFNIGRHPVTNREFLEFLNEHHKRSNSYKNEYGNEIIDFGHRIEKTDQGLRIKDTYEDHPVVGVSWHGAMAYCKWRSETEHKTYRLPFEAEWEKAARGCCGRRYPWGNEFDKGSCNTYESGIKDTTAIGTYDTGMSPYSCHDMVGNVWEWCHDRYEYGYYRDSIRDNPQGPPTGSARMFRGGSWYSKLWGVRSAGRYWRTPAYRNGDFGFRLVLPPGQ